MQWAWRLGIDKHLPLNSSRAPIWQGRSGMLQVDDTHGRRGDVHSIMTLRRARLASSRFLSSAARLGSGLPSRRESSVTGQRHLASHISGVHGRLSNADFMGGCPPDGTRSSSGGPYWPGATARDILLDMGGTGPVQKSGLQGRSPFTCRRTRSLSLVRHRYLASRKHASMR